MLLPRSPSSRQCWPDFNAEASVDISGARSIGSVSTWLMKLITDIGESRFLLKRRVGPEAIDARMTTGRGGISLLVIAVKPSAISVARRPLLYSIGRNAWHAGNGDCLHSIYEIDGVPTYRNTIKPLMAAVASVAGLTE